MSTGAKTQKLFCGLISFLFLAGGCHLPSQRPPVQTKSYLLSISLPQTPPSAKPAYCIAVRPCQSAPEFASKSLVYRVNAVEYQKDYYNQLLASPCENITQALIAWITQLQWTPCIPGTNPKDFYTIIPFLEEFYGDFRDPSNPFAVVKMQLSLTFTDSSCNCTRTKLTRTYEKKILLSKSSVNELINAYSQAVEEILAAFQKEMEHVFSEE